jgi:hypothetical protein
LYILCFLTISASLIFEIFENSPCWLI